MACAPQHHVTPSTTAILNLDADALPGVDRGGFRMARPRRWVKQWVAQESVLNNGKCFVFKWVTEEEAKVPPMPASRPVLELLHPQPILLPTAQRPNPGGVYPCTIDNCGKIFTDPGALRKHAHVHGERQYICQYEGCGKKFVDSSKLKRHHLIHTGEKHFVCPFEGCGKAFSLDFNRRSHMRTHTGENYHTCPVADCGKRFAHENKLRAHMQTVHSEKPQDEKEPEPGPLPAEKKEPRPPEKDMAGRSFVCPFLGCDKRYLHEYKLNLHLKKEHSAGGGGAGGSASVAGTSNRGSEGDSEEDDRENVPLIFSQGKDMVATAGEQRSQKKRGRSEGAEEEQEKNRRGRPPRDRAETEESLELPLPLSAASAFEEENLQSRFGFAGEQSSGWVEEGAGEFSQEDFGGYDPSLYYGGDGSNQGQGGV